MKQIEQPAALAEQELVRGEWQGYTWNPYAISQPKAEPQEPVAWMREGWGPDCGPYVELYRDDEMGWRDRKEWTPLYTAPQPAKQPLTREELFELAEPFGEFQYGDAQGHKRIDFANAIIAAYERKNGIGEQP